MICDKKNARLPLICNKISPMLPMICNKELRCCR